ncbi:MAG: hypothetical protein HYV03_01665 [Deltaproteobacteria bacterium]|nr:hypothetical protein [Deltaproteobacteria bacterium]
MGTERVYKVFGQQVFHGAEVANDPQRGWERAREADERRNRVEASRPEERSSAEKLLYHAGVTIGTIVGAGLSFFGVRCGGDEDEKGKAAGGTEFDSWSSGDASSGPSWDANGSHGDATKAPEATAETKDGEAGETDRGALYDTRCS